MTESTADRYLIPAAFTRVELRIVNSRFLGSADYTPTVAAARTFIDQIRAEMPDATHHTYAYLVGHGASITAGMSDDGEPSGTAGRPMLAVLRGTGLGDVTVVVTRYFGGTKLGTGGLVRAYSDTTKAVLAELPHVERIEKATLLIVIDYAFYDRVCQTLAAHDATIEDETFTADITLTAALPLSAVAACKNDLATRTAGQADIQEL